MIRKVGAIVSRVLAGMIIVAALVLVVARMAGITEYAVLSGSMEPSYPVGSLVFDRPVTPSEIKPGDVITFAASKDTVVTHRVVSVTTADDSSASAAGDADDSSAYAASTADDSSASAASTADDTSPSAAGDADDSTIMFITKGDANASVDANPVYAQNVLGSPVLCVPHLGQAIQTIQTPAGLAVLTALAVLAIFL